MLNQQTLHRCRLAATASPDDLSPDRVLRARGLRQPGLEPAVPQTVSTDAEGFEFPAVAGLVLRGKRSPRPIGPLAGKALECDRTLTANRDGRIGYELLDKAEHVALREPAHPQTDDPTTFVLVGSQPCDPGLGLARQHARRPGKPGPELRVAGRFKRFGKRRGSILWLLRQVFNRHRAGAEVRAGQRRHAARDRAKVSGRHTPLRVLGRNPIETPLFGIAHAVTAHAWIVPVGHDQRAVGGHADVTRPKPPVGRAVDDRLRRRGVASRCGLHMIRPHNIRPRIAVHERSAKPLRQQASLVDADPAGRAATGHEQVGHDARVVLMPVLQRDVGLEVCPRCSPAGACEFVLIAIVAVFQHPVDAHALVAIVVVVALPERAERVDGDFVVVAEVVAKHLEIRAVGLAAEDHPVAERFSRVVHDVAESVLHRIAVFVVHRLSRVAKIKIPPAIGANCKGMHGMIVLRRTRLREERLLTISL